MSWMKNNTPNLARPKAFPTTTGAVPANDALGALTSPGASLGQDELRRFAADSAGGGTLLAGAETPNRRRQSGNQAPLVPLSQTLG